MSVLVETSVGDFVIDLFTKECPLNSQNFLKLCKIKHFNNRLITRVERDFIAIVGKSTEIRTNEDSRKRRKHNEEGDTIWGLIDAEVPGTFSEEGSLESKLVSYVPDEICEELKHNFAGCVGTANTSTDLNNSDFYITLSGEGTSILDEKHTLFGAVVEGLEDVVMKFINSIPVFQHSNVPIQNIRILHTLVIDDPFPDPKNFHRIARSRSPSPIRDAVLRKLETPQDELRLLEQISKNEMRSRAIALEILGDIPDANASPPDNVLFVCKLNPYTEEEDLELIFSRFGKVLSCSIIKDWRTGDSLQYGFVEFEESGAAVTACFEMQDVVVDDRRIHVAFCQSVSQQFNRFRRYGSRTGTQRDVVEINTMLANHQAPITNRTTSTLPSSQKKSKQRLLSQYNSNPNEMVFK